MTPLALLLKFANGLSMVVLPILVGLWLYRRYDASWRIWWIGVATMALAQLGHIPFNILLTQLFRLGLLPAPPEAWVPLFNAVVLGLSAGLWEESFRYFAYRWPAKDARSWGQGLMLGAGHGGIEAIVIGLYVVWFLFQMAALGGVSDLSTVVPAAQVPALQQQLTQYWSAPWYLSLLGIYERLLAMIFHLTASVMVLQVFLRGRLRWLWLAVLWHAVYDAMAVIFAPHSPLLVEGILTALTLLSLALLYYLHRITPDATPEDAAPAVSVAPSAVAIYPVEEVSPEDLEKSRYQ